MGLLSTVRDALFPPVLSTFAALPPVSGDVAQVADLGATVASAFGINLDVTTMTRRQAMCVPAVARGRNLICAGIAQMGLYAARDERGRIGRPEPDAPDREIIRRQLLDQPEPAFSYETTLTWTVDDLLFFGRSWWYVTGRDEQGFPAAVERIDYERVSVPHPVARPGGAPVPQYGPVRIDGIPVRDQDVIRIDGPHEGVLAASSDALRTALDLQTTTRVLSQPSAPMVTLEDQRTVDDPPLTADERDALIDAYEAARRKRATAYVPPSVKIGTPSWDPQRLGLTDAREQMALDVARLLNLNPIWLAAPTGGSLTYTNAREARTELVDLTMAPYMGAIAGRLSMNDVTPRGQAAGFDTSRFLDGTRRDRIEDAAAAADARLVSRTEARNRYLDLPGDAPEQAVTPAAPPTGESQ